VIASRLVYSILLVNTHNAAKPPSALNVTLSYLLLSAGALLQHGACSAPAAIDPACKALSSKLAGRRCCC